MISHFRGGMMNDERVSRREFERSVYGVRPKSNYVRCGILLFAITKYVRAHVIRLRVLWICEHRLLGGTKQQCHYFSRSCCNVYLVLCLYGVFMEDG